MESSDRTKAVETNSANVQETCTPQTLVADQGNNGRPKLAPRKHTETGAYPTNQLGIGDQFVDLEEKSEAEIDYEEFLEDDNLFGIRRAYLVSSAQMAGRRYDEQSFLIGPKLLPKGGHLLITAEAGTGKSAIALYIAACLATGTPLFGMTYAKKDEKFGTPKFPVYVKSDVLYLDYEIPEHIRETARLKPLRDSFGKDFDRNLFFAQHPTNYRLENFQNEGTPGAFDRLLELVKVTRPDVLIIDPFSSTHSLEENSNQIKQALNNIDRIIDRAKITAILIHHSGKAFRNNQGEVVKKDAKENARGHSAIIDWPDTHIQLSEEGHKGGDQRIKHLSVEFGKTRYCAKPRSFIVEADLDKMTFAGRTGLE